MNWDAIAAIGEIIGALAVFISLIYLAVQIRQNTRQITSSIDATRLAAFERNIASGNRVREFFLVNPELAKLYGKGCKNYTELETAEKVKFGLMLRNVFSETQGAYVRQLSIDHDPEGFNGLSRIIDELVAAPGVQEYLQINKPDWRPEFERFVDARIKAIEITPEA